MGILYRVCLIAFAVLVGRLFWMQILQGSHYQTLSSQNRIRLIELPAPRGSLLDRFGQPLVEDLAAYNVVLIPQEIQGLINRERIFTELARQLNVPSRELRQAYQKGYRAPFAPVTLAGNISKEQAIRLEERLFQIPGVFIEVRPVRHYHYNAAAAHVLGFLGEIDPVQLQRLKPYGYKIRDLVGQTGIERNFDLSLQGESGGTQIEVDNRGKIVHILGHRSPSRGKQIQLTLDARLQETAFQLLESMRGSIVVIDPWTGEILAMASSPSFDPNAFVDRKRQGEIDHLFKRRDSPFLNRALAAYPPGSIFKIVVASSGLEKGAITPQSSFNCSGIFELGRDSFDCWKKEGHGLENLSQALTHSCNVYFYHAGLSLGLEAIQEYARLYGLGQLTGVGLLGEAPGLIPTRRWKRKSFQQPWYEGETVNFAIGQGYLLMTPLQAVRMIALVANGGRLVNPYLVKRIGSIEIAQPRSHSTGISPMTLSAIREGLKRVVGDPTGTGQLAQSNLVSIAGKSATAQAPGGNPHAWFIGFAPAENPKIAFAVFLEQGGAGGLSAAPRAKQLVENYLGK